MGQITLYSYYIALFIAVLILPFVGIRAIVLFSQSDPESKMRGRHLLIVVARLLFVLILLPPLIGVLGGILPKANLNMGPSGGNNLTPIEISPSGPGWLFSILISLISFIFVGLEAFIKRYISLLTLPIIWVSEKVDSGGEGSSLLKFGAIDKIWLLFFGLSVLLIIIGFLYNFVKDVIQEATGESTSSERGGSGVMVYLGRALVGLVLAFVSYPVGKMLIWFNGVLSQFIMGQVTFPSMNSFTINDFTAAGISQIQLGEHSIANSIAYMTLAPHTTQFAEKLHLSTAGAGILAIFDMKQAVLLGAFEAYSTFFLIAMAVLFATRIVMIVFWFGLAPSIFAVGGGFKGKMMSISVWFANFMTWAFFPSVVSIILYIIAQITLGAGSLVSGIVGGDNPAVYYFMFILFFAGMTIILKVPGMLKDVFTNLGQNLDDVAGSAISGISKGTGIKI